MYNTIQITTIIYVLIKYSKNSIVKHIVKIHNCKSNAIRSNAAVNYKLKTVMQLCMKISRNQLLRGFAHEDNL